MSQPLPEYEPEHRADPVVNVYDFNPGDDVPPKVRTIAYLVCLLVNVLAVVVLGLLAVFEVMDPTQSAAALGYILAGVGILSNGLALMYRPTRGDLN